LDVDGHVKTPSLPIKRWGMSHNMPTPVAEAQTQSNSASYLKSGCAVDRPPRPRETTTIRNCAGS
jgi:hypothetical protein